MSRGRVLPLFALCATALVGVMAWLTLTVKRLEDAEKRGRDEAAIEETVRLALWRMESQVAPLIAQENSHPYYLYRRSFPARLVATLPADRPELANVPIVSPLASASSPYVRLRYQWDGQGRFSSPQTPARHRGKDADRLTRSSLAVANRLATRSALLDLLSTEWLQVTPPALARREPGSWSAGRPQGSQTEQLRSQQALEEHSKAEAQRRVETQQEMARQQLEPQQTAGSLEQSALQQKTFSKLEYSARAASNAMNLEVQRARAARPTPPSYGTTGVRVGRLQPFWIADELLLARRVRVGTEELVQVCWLDWPALQRWLLAGVSDLLPGARLVPVAAGDEDETRRLAALPVRLLPGAVTPVPTSFASGLQLPLVAAWVLAFVSLAASGALLFGMTTLSERRAAFVSAVTHELRTPLTTFRIYSDMLLDGMVEGEAQRRQYLETLARQAERQSHLVENVLAYSRLERGRYPASREVVTVGALLQSVSGGLATHAEQAGASLLVSLPPGLGAVTLQTDRSAVERILFNLVDNACKYARDAPDRRIHLDGTADTRRLRFTVADHGPGIDTREARRLFRPFHKSARDAAQSAPGVGLGLALSHRLARALGGDLHSVRSDWSGAAFCLELPRYDGRKA